jgi:multidrug transporter EmrE-like cation transporter
MSGFIPVILAVTGGVLYHVSAKNIPRDLAPALVLVVAYATALAISAAGHWWMRGGGESTASLQLLHPGVLGLGIGAALIELGYVLTYRAAWPVSVASVVVSGMVAAVLVVVGVLAFDERLSIMRIGGLLLCLAGVWLLRQ